MADAMSSLPLPDPEALREFWISKLRQWREDASSIGSKFGQTYSRAAHSLKNNPLPFKHSSELTQLKFIGKTIAERLEEETARWCAENKYAVPEKPAPSRKQRAAREQRQQEASQHEDELNSWPQSQGAAATAKRTQHDSTGASGAASTAASRLSHTSLSDKLDEAVKAGVARQDNGKDKEVVTGDKAKERPTMGFLSDSTSASESDSGSARKEVRWPNKRTRMEQSAMHLDAVDGDVDGGLEKRAAAAGMDIVNGKALEPAPARLKKPRPPKAPNIYIPAHRSGGYGIMLALWSVTRDAEVFATGGSSYLDEEDSNTFPVSETCISSEANEVYLRKNEIIGIAQKWCDLDYLLASRGSSTAVAPGDFNSANAGDVGGAAASGGGGAGSFRTAWSSMKTLINRGYVYQTGNPPRFCLSEEGMQVVKGMAQVAGLRRPPAGIGTSTEAPLSAAADATAGSTTVSAAPLRSEQRHTSKNRPRVRGSRNSEDKDDDDFGDSMQVSAQRKDAVGFPKRSGPKLMLPATRPASRSQSPMALETNPVPALTRAVASAPTTASASVPPPASASALPPTFAYMYLSRTSALVFSRAEAAVRLSDVDYTTTYAVLFAERSREHSIVRSGAIEKVGSALPMLAAGSSAQQGLCKGWIREEASNERAPGLSVGVGRRQPAALAPAGASARAKGGDASRSAGQPVTVILDDTDDEDADAGITSQAPPHRMQMQRSTAVGISNVEEEVVETVTISAGFFELKDRRQNVPTGGSHPERQAPPVTRAPRCAVSTVSPIQDADMLDDEIDDDADLFVEFQCQEEQQSKTMESQAEESQGIQLAPRGLYTGLYGQSQSESQRERQQHNESASASATKNNLHRRPRLSGVLPPPAIAISWHNAIVPTASISRNNSALGTNASAASTRTASDHEQTVAEQHGFKPPQFEPVIMPAGSFSIHLLIDTREVRARGQQPSRANDFAQSLQAMGILAESRALPLGDAVWIARRKDGGKGEEDEAVLDFIVERKRLDDLNSSIKDGRWREQKFRLSNSGLSHVVYLVEDYDIDQQWSSFGESLQTALSSTQIVDGYFVERTADVEQSLQYLTSMHTVVQEMWENTDLYILPDSAISRHTYLDLQTYLRRTHPQLTYLTSYASYATLNAKSGSLTVRDLWARMLLCIKGLSAEKVAEVLDLWPTPIDFYEACLEKEEEMRNGVDTGPAPRGPAKGLDAGQRMLFEHIQGPEQRRKIGAALSVKVWDFFMKRQYATASGVGDGHL
ncbi:hypothetical protein K437DRAFT_247592 [Tilletiaria anomala UBC 951]|uniref:Crossover junction endonuclease MUS81 n=1 Tax=Tilletiaria anomala (strain ATCC 24038 / CBS 436.72 / UBC 951) TaxID=1037660 RepID=A0A066W0Z6_TILAU|nr:uncharacterized protein K437DRAFT_247592 [Tilletiaria anomala UBC 951]KDN44739.1 hypothetical protein K437DRAFT_247592 [Tilletiaria anomala UBC 951]